MKIRHIDVKIVQKDVPAPVLAGAVDEFTVRAAVREVLENAEAADVASVLLPSVGAGAGFPLIGCAKIISQEVLRACREGKGGLREIMIALSDKPAFDLFEKQVFGYLRHVTEDLSWGPYVCVDAIIEIDGGLVVIERTNPPFGFALPGGFVDRGESLEDAVRREAKEETDLELADVKQFHTYSDPSRDPRFHTITTMYTAKGIGTPNAGDDAKALRVVPFAELRSLKYAFDHAGVIDDYLKSRGI